MQLTFSASLIVTSCRSLRLEFFHYSSTSNLLIVRKDSEKLSFFCIDRLIIPKHANSVELFWRSNAYHFRFTGFGSSIKVSIDAAVLVEAYANETLSIIPLALESWEVAIAQLSNWYLNSTIFKLIFPETTGLSFSIKASTNSFLQPKSYCTNIYSVCFPTSDS